MLALGRKTAIEKLGSFGWKTKLDVLKYTASKILPDRNRTEIHDTSASMKASQVLTQYERGRRDFKRVNLRGQSFVGKDLSGADFSEADIRGANFSRANLTGTKFAGAKAGVQRRWVAVQSMLALVMFICSGLLATIPGIIIFVVIDAGDDLAQKLAFSIPITMLLITTYVAILRQGFTVRAVNSIAIVGTVLETVTVATFVVFFFLAKFLVSKAGESLGSVIATVFTAVLTVPLAAVFTVVATLVLFVAGSAAIAIVLAAVFSVTFAITLAFSAVFAVAGVFASVGAGAGVLAIGGAIAFFSVSDAGFTEAVAVGVAVIVAFAFPIVILSLYVAWRAMKGDEKFAIVRLFAVFFGSLGGTRFYRATLTDANFTGATLKSCNFRNATLLRTCWKNAQKLDRVRSGNTPLANPAVRQLLITGSGYNQSYIGANLHGANLTGADLQHANLKRADLSHATLHQANLKSANLTETLAIGTDFTAAYLTGACLEAWNLDSTTQLAGVDCQYVFLLEAENDKGSRERRPHDPDRVFQPGDFEKLYQKMMNVVQILLRNGIDKEAFKDAFQKLMEEYPDLTCDSIQGIERKGKDFLLTVQIPETADKSQVERLFHEAYEAKLSAAKAVGELEAEKRRSQDMKDIVLALAENSSADIKVEQTSHNQTITENQIMNANNPTTKNTEVEMTFQKEVTGVAGKVMGNQNVHAKQTLAESAVEIQQLLQILDRSYPSNIPADTQAEIDVAVKGIAKNPALKERVVGALKAGGIEALKELTENPYVNILLAAYEGWQSP